MLPAESATTEALGKVRSGLLLVFIAWILLGAGLLFMFLGILIAWSIRAGPPAAPPEIPARIGLPRVFLAGLVLTVVGAVLALVGFYARFIPGVGELARVKPEFSTASTLIKVGYLGGLILVVAGILLLLVLVGILLIVLGLVFLLVGHIGTSILCFKLKDVYQSSLYLIAGILFIVSIFVPVLAAVSCVLLYVALGDTISKLKSQTQATY